ncbi:MAG: class I SAM-dependent methyltransferase [Anaerolineae bacterium]|nr:class I SAM-dependent methyltransferase [Anaerolineae bacterium]
MSEHHKTPSKDRWFLFDQEEITLDDFDAPGYILDIGGGGEGIIGILKGEKVIAIDGRKGELEEAAEGPLKIVMDARELKFLDNTFETATAFFCLMYVKEIADQKQIFDEVYRVLKSGGEYLIWDVNIPEQQDEKRDIFVIPLKIKVASKEVETGYGQLWPPESRPMAFYVRLAQESGFRVMQEKDQGRIFFLRLQKP